MNHSEVAHVLSALHGAYPRLEVDESVAIVWRNALSSHDYDTTMRVIGKWIGTQSRWPTIAEINADIRLEAARAEEQKALPPEQFRPATREQAMKALIGGMRSEYARRGYKPDEIEQRIRRRFPMLEALVANAPA